ncbi:hypothetical protein QBC47DRAFT_308514 [Echria macrotheca]|uniref:C2H2-type domain-containing protein n=1 Tax=Echria macrotheca TaxID=438768 RepID=A0AAJ0B3M9_9PEZI|nr:hypothetical protein QBC47DRAFT_308514 [Echria macrotheca]
MTAEFWNPEQVPCPSLWTGSTKDTQSDSGHDRSAHAVEGVGIGSQPMVNIVLEADHDSHLPQLDEKGQTEKGRDVPRHSGVPLGPFPLSDPGTDFVRNMPSPGRSKGKNKDNDDKTTSGPSSKRCRSKDRELSANTSSTWFTFTTANSSTKSGETDPNGSESEAEDDYCSDYTPDVPHMSATHPFMQHKPAVLSGLLERFSCWLVPKSPATDTQTDNHSSQQESREKLSQIRNKRARDGFRKDDSNTGSDEQDPRLTNAKKPRREEKQRRPRLACPYYKKAPMRYYDCHGKILSSISHLKQHLSRNHQLPVYCPICQDIFLQEADRDVHVQLRACDLRTDIVHEGLTRNQKEQLKRRASPTVPEEQQWFEIFDILFPGHNPRPTSAYINAELAAETENYLDFERAEGPRIILETLRGQGVSLSRLDNPEHDLGVFRENVLADALARIAQAWQESRSALDGTARRAEAGSASSLLGAPSSTGGRTLVESQDGGVADDQSSLVDKIIDADDGHQGMLLRQVDGATAPASEITDLVHEFPPEVEEEETGTDTRGYNSMPLFQFDIINWSDEDT